MFAGLHYLFCKKDAPLADKFFNQIADGNNLRKHHPVLVLRRHLNGQRNKTMKQLSWYNGALAVLAWNAMRKNKNLEKLEYHPANDDFPLIE